jgi:hypothetical protein
MPYWVELQSLRATPRARPRPTEPPNSIIGPCRAVSQLIWLAPWWVISTNGISRLAMRVWTSSPEPFSSRITLMVAAGSVVPAIAPKRRAIGKGAWKSKSRPVTTPKVTRDCTTVISRKRGPSLRSSSSLNSSPSRKKISARQNALRGLRALRVSAPTTLNTEGPRARPTSR